VRSLLQTECFPFLPSAGTLTVEQIYQDRDQFAKLVREVAAPDVGRMGIEILSFTIKVRPDAGCCACRARGRAVGAAQQSLALAPLLQLADRRRLTACPSPPGVSMTAAAACPVSRLLGEEHLVSCLRKHGSWRELTDNRASREPEGRCPESPPLPVTSVSGSGRTWLVLTLA